MLSFLNAIRVLFPVALFNFGTHAFAHGENKPGPHGGVIRMPSSFHVEVVSGDSDRLTIYLLDDEFRNPVTRKSSVKVHHVKGKERTALVCEAVRAAFLCGIPAGVSLLSGKLEIEAARLEVESDSFDLPLPLRTP